MFNANDFNNPGWLWLNNFTPILRGIGVVVRPLVKISVLYWTCCNNFVPTRYQAVLLLALFQVFEIS